MGIEEGLALARELRARLSGLAQPFYVLDLPGGFGKVVLDSTDVEKTERGHRIRDLQRRWHDYPPHDFSRAPLESRALRHAVF